MTVMQVTTRLLLPHVEIFGSLLLDKQFCLFRKNLEHVCKPPITIMHNATDHFHPYLEPRGYPPQMPSPPKEARSGARYTT